MDPSSYSRHLLKMCLRNNIQGYLLILCMLGLSFVVINKYIKAVSQLEDYALVHSPDFQGHKRGENACKGILKVYDTSKKIDEKIECVKLATVPPTNICVFESSEDRFISGLIKQNRGWEMDMVQLFQHLLQGDEDLGLLDLGANIGVYSLVAAAMKRPVVAVEPVINNLLHLAKSVQVNQYDLITVLPYAVTDSCKNMSMSLNPNNQGAHRLVSDKEHDYSPNREKTEVQTILMDDILPFIPFKKAILKIDVEGQEHRAFVHSNLLMNNVQFPYLFMEWEIVRSYYCNKTHVSEDKELAENLITLLLDYGYTPFETVTFGEKPSLDSDRWGRWPNDIIWSREEH